MPGHTPVVGKAKACLWRQGIPAPLLFLAVKPGRRAKRAAALALGGRKRAWRAWIVYAAARVSPRGITAHLQTD